MFILVSGASRTVERLASHPNLGVLVTPRTWNAFPPRGTVWAADNAAFGGFDDAAFRPFLRKLSSRPDVAWVACPDVVGDAAATLDLWATWAPIIRAHGLRPALVAQDGLTARRVPWPEVGAIFIGGRKGSPYKTGEAAAEIVGEANRRGLWTHMGRVNSAKRILFAAAIGCRSVDGSGFSRFAEEKLPWALEVSTQIPLGIE